MWEAEGHVGTIDIIVNGLGQADDVQPFLAEQIGGLVGAVAAQAEQAVQFGLLIGLFHRLDLVDVVLLDDAHFLERGALCAKDGAAHRQDAGKLAGVHVAEIAVDQAVIAVEHADDLHLVAHTLIQCLGSTADGGVQAGAVAAGSQNTDTFFSCNMPPLCRGRPR